jgi:hypothetical protein
VMIVMILKMTLHKLMLLLMKRIVMWRNKAKVILLATLAIQLLHLGGHEQLLFSNYSGPQNSAVNVQDIVSVILLFFHRDSS